MLLHKHLKLNPNDSSLLKCRPTIVNICAGDLCEKVDIDFCTVYLPSINTYILARFWSVGHAVASGMVTPGEARVEIPCRWTKIAALLQLHFSTICIFRRCRSIFYRMYCTLLKQERFLTFCSDNVRTCDISGCRLFLGHVVKYEEELSIAKHVCFICL